MKFFSQNQKYIFLCNSNGKNILHVHLIEIAFFAFLLPFFEAFGEIIDAFQLHVLKEELIIYKT